MFQSVKNNFRRIFLKNYCENMLSEIFFFKFYFFQNFSFFETEELTSAVTIVFILLSIYIWSMKYFCLAIKIFFVFNSLQNVKMFQSVKNNFWRICESFYWFTKLKDTCSKLSIILISLRAWRTPSKLMLLPYSGPDIASFALGHIS